MLLSFGKAKTVLCLLPLVAPLGGAPREAPQQILRIRVSQETSPGAGDFDRNVLGFIEALNTDGSAASFYRYEYRRYGNTAPVLTSKTSHLFFVNGSDGVALFVVHNSPNRNESSSSPVAAIRARFELSGGTASILQSDDRDEATSSGGGTVFTTRMLYPASNTDGMVVGTLPVGFTILGQFTEPPRGLEGGWLVISADGTVFPLQMVPGQRVRLDVRLVVAVQQEQP
jgi:hypothetical protein